MRADNIGALPVGENDRLIGMVTDRDIAMSCRNASIAVSRTMISSRRRK
jgi:CBS domain-containing protein